MSKPQSKLTNYISVFFLVLIIGGGGFYFGFKTKSNQDLESITNLQQENNKLQADQKSNTKLEIKEVEAIRWIKPNEDPKCPSSHPVKGIFRTDKSLFYLPNNKNYDKINADICFVSEKYAIDSAGFIKKF